MSFPNIPNITPAISLSTAQTVPLLLASIALEEFALAHLLNAEAEKLQFILGTLTSTSTTFSPATVSVSNLLAVDASVQRTLRDVIKKEMLLEFKFENVLDLVASLAPSPVTPTAFLFVSNFDGNTVSIFDVTDRINPVFLREFGADHLNGPTGLAITGTTLYVSNFNANTVSVYDISTPTDPVFVRGFGAGELAGPWGLLATGTDLFVANYSNNTVAQYITTDPANPHFIGTIDTGNGPNGIAIKDRTLYVSNQLDNTIGTFAIVDDTPEHQMDFSSEELKGPTGLAINGDFLYASNFNDSTAAIFNITDPDNPIDAGLFGVGELSGPQGMVLFPPAPIFPPAPVFPPNPCYVANMNNNTVSIYDVTVPSAPVRVGQISSHLRAPVGLAIFLPSAPI